jgi:hypothetical protein
MARHGGHLSEVNSSNTVSAVANEQFAKHAAKMSRKIRDLTMGSLPGGGGPCVRRVMPIAQAAYTGGEQVRVATAPGSRSKKGNQCPRAAAIVRQHPCCRDVLVVMANELVSKVPSSLVEASNVAEANGAAFDAARVTCRVGVKPFSAGQFGEVW